MADGNIVYQGPAIESPRYFDLGGDVKTKFLNPCDFFMKELSVNYPKTEEDEAKITKYIQLYKEICEPKILKEIRENKIEDLEINYNNDITNNSLTSIIEHLKPTLTKLSVNHTNVNYSKLLEVKSMERLKVLNCLHLHCEEIES